MHPQRPQSARTRKRLWPTLAAALTFALILTGLVPAAQAATFTVSGRLVTAAGAPVVGATATGSGYACDVNNECVDAPDIKGTTDANGAFTITKDVRPDVDYSMSFAHDDDQRFTAWHLSGDPELIGSLVALAAGRPSQTIVVYKESDTFTLSGTLGKGTGAARLLADGLVCAHDTKAFPSAGPTGSFYVGTKSVQCAAVEERDDGTPSGRFAFHDLIPGEQYKLYFGGATDIWFGEQWVGGADYTQAKSFSGTAGESVAAGDLPLTRWDKNDPATFPALSLDPEQAVTEGQIDLQGLEQWKVHPASLKVTWYRNNKAAETSTWAESGRFSYFPTSGDAGRDLYARITADFADGTHRELSTNHVTITNPPYIDQSLWADGDLHVGGALQVTGSVDSPADAKVSITWTRGPQDQEEVIPGTANKRRYVLTAADLGQRIMVHIKVTANGYRSYESSREFEPILAARATVGVPTISGAVDVGSTLTAKLAQAVPSGTALAFQWKRDGKTIAGASSSKYVLSEADRGHNITVAVTAAKPGYLDRTEESEPVYLELRRFDIGDVSVSGDPVPGQTLTAKLVSAPPAGTTLTYQWYSATTRDGRTTPIPKTSGGTSAAYKVQSKDLNHYLTVTVEGARTGYWETTASSKSFRVVSSKEKVQRSGTVKLSGKPQVGQTLTVDPGTWSPDGTKLTFYWIGHSYSGDTEVTFFSNVTGPRYTLGPDDYGSKFEACVDGTFPGTHDTAQRCVTSATVTTGKLPVGTVTVSGSVKVGSDLAAVISVKAVSGEKRSFTWMRDGKSVGAHSQHYRVTRADAGHKLSVKVTRSAWWYDSATLVSPGRAVPALVRSVSAGTVAITGTAKVGSTLKAKTTAWSPSGVKLSYQWLRNGKTISKATGSSYKLTKSDKGTKVSLKVTGSRTGYTTKAVTSPKTTTIK